MIGGDGSVRERLTKQYEWAVPYHVGRKLEMVFHVMTHCELAFRE